MTSLTYYNYLEIYILLYVSAIVIIIVLIVILSYNVVALYGYNTSCLSIYLFFYINFFIRIYLLYRGIHCYNRLLLYIGWITPTSSPLQTPSPPHLKLSQEVSLFYFVYFPHPNLLHAPFLLPLYLLYSPVFYY
jgi:hypothetical protein